MDALLSCARAGIPTRRATLYATTFPCHNCAKHIVAAGVSRVVFIEPYPKSKAAEFHKDSIQVGFGHRKATPARRDLVRFEPFVGIGPRRFFDLFSARLGSGYTLKRKDVAGKKLEWKPEQGRLRLQMLPASYLDLEFIASDMFNKARRVEEDKRCRLISASHRRRGSEPGISLRRFKATLSSSIWSKLAPLCEPGPPGSRNCSAAHRPRRRWTALRKNADPSAFVSLGFTQPAAQPQFSSGLSAEPWQPDSYATAFLAPDLGVATLAVTSLWPWPAPHNLIQPFREHSVRRWRSAGRCPALP